MTSSRDQTNGHVLLQKQNPIPKHFFHGENQTFALILLKRIFVSASSGKGGMRSKSKNSENIITSLHSFRGGRTKPPILTRPTTRLERFFLFTAFRLAHMNLHSFEDARDEIMLTEKLQSRINKTHLSICLWRRRLWFVGASV